VVDLAQELAARGFVEFSTDRTKFWLKEAGYDEAAKGPIQRALEFLNKNGGISILISIVSLIVAILALAKKT
jgi:hypothetical protein